MDSITYKKYTLLKTNNYIWKKIWSIKDNDNRNEYINTLLLYYIKYKCIDFYNKDTINIGMPKKKYEIYYDLFFNLYTLKFDIIIYYTIDNIKQYSNYTYKNGQPEDIFLYLMKHSLIKNTHLLNNLLKQLQFYKNKWYYYLQHLVKQITYNNGLYDMEHHILSYLMELE